MGNLRLKIRIILVQLHASWLFHFGIRSYCREGESESDVASRWVYREYNLIFILSNDKDQRKTFAITLAFA